MHYSLHMPHPARSLAIPLAAAVLGAGAATATYAIIDNDGTTTITLPAISLPSFGDDKGVNETARGQAAAGTQRASGGVNEAARGQAAAGTQPASGGVNEAARGQAAAGSGR